MDFDPVYWPNPGRQAAVVLGIGVAFGWPLAYVVVAGLESFESHGRRPDCRHLGLALVGYLYLTFVLCPPEAGCA